VLRISSQNLTYIKNEHEDAFSSSNMVFIPQKSRNFAAEFLTKGVLTILREVG